MGRHAVIVDDVAEALDAPGREATLGDQSSESFAYERKDAINDLIMTMPPQTAADVVVQLGIALNRIRLVEYNASTEAELTAVLARVRRVMLGALPVLAREAGIDLTMACGSWIAEACEGAFPSLVQAASGEGAAC